MASSSKNIAGLVEELISSSVKEAGYDLWDVEYLKEGASWYLRITIDKDDGIDIDDCERVHNIVEPIIDRADPIEGFYYLDVSSPGIERNLRTADHFRKCVGERAILKFFTKYEGRKELLCEILGVSEDGSCVEVDSDNEKRIIDLKTISKANVYYDFSNEPGLRETI